MIILYTMLFSTLGVIAFAFCICHTKLDKDKKISDKELSEVVKKMGSNVQIVESVLKFIGNTTTTVAENKDQKAQISFYQPNQDKIIVKPTEDLGECGRLVHIAHECVHSIQPKKLLMSHFILSNINLIYFLGIFAGLFYVKDTNIKVILLVIQILIFSVTMFLKMMLEADATYRAVDVATGFLKGKVSADIIESFREKVKNELYPMIPTFYFTLFFQNAFLLVLAQVGAILL